MDKVYAEKLKKDLLENGMVSESLPEYINSKGLSAIKFKELKKSKTRCSSSMTVNLLKKDGGNRVIYLPNPVSYQQCVNTIFKDLDIVEKILDKIEKNPYSHSRVLTDDDKTFNIPIKGYRSKYMDSVREKMYLSIGKKYKLKYDIEKFYDNIYTHYLAAGLIGFENSLEMYREHMTHSIEYKYMENVDTDIRNMCNGETKGIITGPYVSRIFSELLQAEIDNEIKEKTQNEKFRRYVDDTEMYLKNRDEAEKNIIILKNIFQKYKLSLKMEKTEVKKIPYIDFKSLRELLTIRIEKNENKKGWYFASQDDFFEVIHKTEELQKNGQDGALKYILKILNSQKYEYGINKKFEEKDKSFLYLLNYILIYPQYAKEILKIVDKQIGYIEESEKVLNDFLKDSVENNQELVCLYIIQILVKNQLLIEDEIIKDYLKDKEGNELLKAVFAEYICERNEDRKYDQLIDEYKKTLKGSKKINFRYENWLSKYILYYYDYIDETDCVIENNFLENMKLYKLANIKFINFDLLK